VLNYLKLAADTFPPESAEQDEIDLLRENMGRDFKDYFLDGLNSLHYSINDNLDVVIQISCQQEEELFKELNSSFRPKEIPIIKKILPLMNDLEKYRTDIKLRFELKIA